MTRPAAPPGSRRLRAGLVARQTAPTALPLGCMGAPSLKAILARVGEEKARVHAERSGLSETASVLERVQQSLDLYEQLVPLRLARLTTELGSEEAAKTQLRAEAALSAHEQEIALLRTQTRLYGNRH